MRFDINHSHHNYHKLWLSNNGFYGVAVINDGFDMFSLKFLVREHDDIKCQWYPIKTWGTNTWHKNTEKIIDIMLALKDFQSVNPMFINADGKHEFLLIEELI